MRWTIIACVAIVAFDAVYALAAKALNFEYGGFPGVFASTAIYAFPAFMASRSGRGVRVAALAGATVALVDATVGWAVSWLIGPGAPPRDSRSPEALVFTTLTVVAVGAVVGLGTGIIVRGIARMASANARYTQGHGKEAR